MTPEARVKKKIRDLLKAHGAYYAQPIMQGMASNGTPDILVCHRGRFIGIEAKATEKNKPTELQKVRLAEIEKAGGAALVIHAQNLDTLERLLAELEAK